MATDNRKTILLVEDEPLIAVAEQRKIKAFGYEVVTANSGEKAVEIALTRPDIGLILLDVDLGQGIEGTEAARRILQKRSLPIVFVTSQNNPDTVEKLRGIMRYGYVLKGSGDFVLQASIESAFELFAAHEKSRSAPANREPPGPPSQRSDSVYRLLVENTKEGVAVSELVFDAAGQPVDLRYIMVNPAYERYTGLKPGTILGEKMRELLPETDRPRIDTWMNVALRGESDTFECYSKSLHRHLMVRSFSPRQGQVATIYEDIDELTQIKKSLELEFARRQILFDLSPDGILVIDPTTGQFIEFNATAHNQLGYSREEFARLSIGDIEAQESPEETRARISDVAKNGRLDFETLHATRQGTLRNVHVTAQFATIDGTSVYYCTWRDITERVAAEEALMESETRFRVLFQKHAATMLLLEPGTGRIVDANASALQFYGYSLEKIRTLRIHDINAAGPDEVARALEHAASSSLKQFVFPHRLSSGEIRTVEVHSSPIEYSGKTILFSIIVDISERKKAEDANRILLSEKEILLKEVHHRIKNNMSLVQSLLSLQAAAVQDPAARASLNDAKDRVRSMMLLYDKLYRSSQFSDVPIDDYLVSLLDQIVGNFPNRGAITIEKHLEPFIIDARHLSSVGMIVNELVSNIMKYAFTGRQAGRITVSASKRETRVRVIVQDDGIGMPPAFDLHSSTGFGLQLVTMLTDQLEGTIMVDHSSGTKWTLEFGT